MQQVLLAFIRWIALSSLLTTGARSIIITQIYKQKPLNNLTCVKQWDSVFCFDENTERDCVLEFICACRYEELMNRNVITFEIWNIVLTILMCSLISVICHRSIPFDCKRQNFDTVHRKFVKIGELCRGYHACYIWVTLIYSSLSLVQHHVSQNNPVSESLWNGIPGHHQTRRACVICCKVGWWKTGN